MVLLTMTAAIVAALAQSPSPTEARESKSGSDDGKIAPSAEPSLSEPEVGKPIAHGQIIDIWRRLKKNGTASISLEQLLMGAKVYNPPPPPKPEPSKQYVALMARLRREEEQRAYERMINPPAPLETFSQLYPNSGHASFAEANRVQSKDDLGDEETTYNDVHRQLMLLINFLVSIVGVAGTLWVAARWWSTPARLFLALGGSIVVAVAEVAVYQIYVWRMGEAKGGQEKKKEVKEVVKTWIVGEDGITEKAMGKTENKSEDEASVLLKEKIDDTEVSVRKRIPIEAIDEGS